MFQITNQLGMRIPSKSRFDPTHLAGIQRSIQGATSEARVLVVEWRWCEWERKL